MEMNEALKNIKIMVVQEFVTSKSNGKDYANYRIRVSMRGREKKIDLKPKEDDGAGYDLLLTVYEGVSELPLVVEWKENRDLSTGRLTSAGFQYRIVSKDEDGVEYSCDMKPYGSAHKSLLESLIKRLLKDYETEESKKKAPRRVHSLAQS